MKMCQGGLGWTLGQDISHRGWWGSEQAPQGLVMAPRLLRRRLAHGGMVGATVQGQELDSMALWVPFQLGFL